MIVSITSVFLSAIGRCDRDKKSRVGRDSDVPISDPNAEHGTVIKSESEPIRLCINHH